ncbi:MAG: chaperone, ATP12 [Acidisphaera sp.]|nr:chaperone, ATP12 [Acidisphaera sp.]
MRRFWDKAEAAADADSYAIMLDGRPVRLPSGAVLRPAQARLAEAIAAEWQRAGGAPGGEMSFADVPLTRLAGTAQQRIAPDPGPTIQALAAYAQSDLLCYRAAAPEALVHRQARAWQPWLDWAALELDAPLRSTSGVMPVTQPPEALLAIQRALAAHAPERLAALGLAVPALGSVVLGLAMAAGQLGAAAAHGLAALDELFQAEHWGEDSEAAARRARIGGEIALAARFMELSGPQ